MLEKILNTKNKLSSITLAISIAGCGTTIQQYNPKRDVWYECNTRNEYPLKHPCYTVIKKHHAAQSNYSSPLSSLTNNERDSSYDRWRQRRDDNSDHSGHYEKDKSHWEKPDGGHWEKPK